MTQNQKGLKLLKKKKFLDFSWRLDDGKTHPSTPEELLAYNDKHADLTLTIGSLALAIATLIAEVGGVIGVIEVQDAIGVDVFGILFVVFMMPVVGYLVTRGRWRQHRYFALTFIALAIAMSNVIYQTYWLVVLPVPLLLSILYYSKRLVVYVGSVTAVFIAAAYFIIFYLELQYPAYVEYQYEYLGVLSFDDLADVFTGAIVPFVLHLSVITVIAYIVASCGRYLVFRQAEITSEAFRAESELEMAATLQRDIMPRNFDVVAQEGMELFAAVRPAKETAGDFYDFFVTEGEDGVRTLNAVVADVSDKGLPAAMFMMLARNTLRTTLRSGVPLGRAVETANAILCDDNKEMMFVTALVMRIDVQTGRVELVNAGHASPLVRDAAGNVHRVCSTEMEADIFLGVMEDAKYSVHTFGLLPGDVLVAYTDGATDAESPEGEFFGEERLFEAIADAPAHPEELIESIFALLREYSDHRPRFDDATLLAVRFSEAPQNS